MKIIIVIFISTFLLSCAVTQKDIVPDKALKAKTQVFQDGNLIIKETYRYDKKIMVEVINKRKNTHVRMLILNNKPIYTESDENGDGFFEMIMITESFPAPFEMFIRNRDGTIVPLPSIQYEQKYNKVRAAHERFRKVFKKVALEEKAKLEKEGKPITGWLKEQLEQFEKE